MKSKTPKIIPVSEWAKKNNLSDRHARRLVQQKKIPTVPLMVETRGVPSDVKWPA